MSEKKYKSISEVSELLNINMHIIRYWDSKFDGISTKLSNNKRRFFNNENIKKLKDLKNTLYNNGKHNYSLDLAKKIIENRNITSKIDSPILSRSFKKSLDDKALDIVELQKISNNLKKLLII